MFDITPDEINQLNDIDLRELVGRLCEAELASRLQSPSAVTWGGNQTAADGGLDVRVALPTAVSIEGFIPRSNTGFQVKKPDMPRSKIVDEMRPNGIVRPILQDLANVAGAYVIVSSTGSTTDSALSNRQNAMREALDGVDNADQLYTDFYDRTRLATWVRRHPGLITWVKEKVSRALDGWRPYGPWSASSENVDAEYLLDDKLSLHLGGPRDEPAQSVAEVIDRLRDKLSQPGKIVRLVGLSGVGKTRLAQALFDDRIGLRFLPKSLAVYTNLSDNPDPQPTGLVSDLIVNRLRAVLIVDNCPPDLHRRLCELCSGQASLVSVLTIEYDVRDDQPEGTQVVTLDTSSQELIEKLVCRRYPHLSKVDAQTIAEASGGNARIAITLAETVKRTDTIAGLSNEELFQRLFRQRQESDNSLLLAAQACSLVYSFNGEALEGEGAELPQLAFLAGQLPTETFRHVAELLRRDLVQQRGVWRAVLPHAIANRLAAHALEDTPFNLINQQLVNGRNERLARSFSRRLSFLHDHPKAIEIVKRWLSQDGILGDPSSFNELQHAMFENIAPVLPEETLAALERACKFHPDEALMVLQQHMSLLRSLAYDCSLFERSTKLLAHLSTQSKDRMIAQQASELFVSLFMIYLSGTHASIDQRLGVLERLLICGENESKELGLLALEKVLETRRFSSSDRFKFGARSRDFGYMPRSSAEVTRWYGSALSLIERLGLKEGLLKTELRDLLARNFRGLWALAHMRDELERLFRMFAADGFWREGWVACRQTIHFDRKRLSSDEASRLSALVDDLRPTSLLERVRAVVLGDRAGELGLEDMDIEDDSMTATERLEITARELGCTVASDDEVFAELLNELLRGGNQVWMFGKGLAEGSKDLRATWTYLVKGLEWIASEQRNVQVLRGFLAELWDKDRVLAHDLLDLALDQPALKYFLPLLHSAVSLDKRCVERLKLALGEGKSPIWMYRDLSLDGSIGQLDIDKFKDLILVIADEPNGFEIALDIFYMRLHSDCSSKREHEAVLLEGGRELLQRITFCKHQQHEDYQLAGVVKACLSAQDADPIAAEIATRLRQAVAAKETYSFDNKELLTALLKVQPIPVLNVLLGGNEQDQRVGINLFEDISDLRVNPADVISCETLIAWCEGDKDLRYRLAASIISFANCPEENGPQVWSEHAKALFTNAPDFQRVLAVISERFRPQSWGGSRAAIMERNASLFDSLETFFPYDFMPIITEAKARIAEAINRERQLETRRDRVRDERFE